VLYSFADHLIENGAIRDKSPGLVKHQQQVWRCDLKPSSWMRNYCCQSKEGGKIRRRQRRKRNGTNLRTKKQGERKEEYIDEGGGDYDYDDDDDEKTKKE